MVREHAAGRLVGRATARQQAAALSTEMWGGRDNLQQFMQEASADFRRDGIDVIYGAVRLIEQDRETFLAWARKSLPPAIMTPHSGVGGWTPRPR